LNVSHHPHHPQNDAPGPAGALIALSVQHRRWVVALTLLAAAAAAWWVRTTTFDAFPDLTNVQVQVLTSSPGLGAVEVERFITIPLERSLTGIAHTSNLRSISRPGVSSVTVVFDDGVDPWLARQMVKERVDAARADIPPEAGDPALAPPTTGLGEIFQFTLTSDDLPPSEVYRLFQRDLAPRLRTVDGVVEVNVWGAGSPQVDVRVDPWALAHLGLRFTEVERQLGEALRVTSGGDVEAGAERVSVRALTNPATPEELGELPLVAPDGAVVRLADVARVGAGTPLTVGLGSAGARGEALFVVVQMLAGADARTTVAEVRDVVATLKQTLPPSVRLDVVYDRGALVDATLHTVAKSLVEGGVLVVIVLLLVLGDLRAGLLVGSVIPLSMLGAFVGLRALGWSGNLMSLGAIDFGLVVDGSIVVVESVIALDVAAGASLATAVVDRGRRVARPVLFAVGILILVYLPVLGMVGTEGKLFRPMAVTVLMALLTALVLSFTWIPALSAMWLSPSGHHETWLVRALKRPYGHAASALIDRPGATAAAVAVAVAGSALLASRLGVEFVPRLEEGDLVLQTTRPASVGPREALREATRIERALLAFPEVAAVASRIGSPAVATDPMGLEESDLLIRLNPRDTWQTESLEALVEALSDAVTREAPGAALTFTQPIEMRFNELLEGITSDVGVAIHGPDGDVLTALGQRVADAISGVDGAVDVKAPAVEGLPGLRVDVPPDALTRYGVDGADVHGLVAGVRRGRTVGAVTRGEFRDAVVLRVDWPADVDLADLPVARGPGAVTLGDVAQIVEEESLSVIRRQLGTRRVVVQANVRGRDLGGFVEAAEAAVAAIELPPGYWLDWAGRYEQLAAARGRLMVTVPLVLVAVLGLLYRAFGDARPAWLIFLNIPAAASGGVLALWLRGLPISVSAMVGFVALFGIAVMNGIVLVSRSREIHAGGATARVAALSSALERFRPVLLTATVAGIGFLPMALAHGVGAEVQRPLATVVIGGLCTSTPLTLLVLPTLYARFVRPPRADSA
jgi:cobalt-zinc-cadmium resistance protein CzcA